MTTSSASTSRTAGEVGPVDASRPADAFGGLEGEELRRVGRLAGMLMLVGALASIPAALFLEPAPEPYELLIGLGSALVGVAALLAPWARMSSAWLHVGMILATLEIAVAVAALSDDYAFFYVLVAMFAAYVIRSRAALIAYVVLLAVALCAPIAYADDTKDQIHHMLVTLPVLVITAIGVRYLRDVLERRELQVRGFAVEAVALAERIRGRPELGPSARSDLERRLDDLAAAELRDPHGDRR
jgi:hypothetical protein